jgi:hypothetical protein
MHRTYKVHGAEMKLPWESVEYYKEQGVPVESVGLAHDVDRIQRFYGKRRINNRIIEYFRKRMSRKWGSKN